jgi:hypothetical protein
MVKPIAFYLPQYHPIPENDEWWGKGFTEWTNVTKAKPLFDGHFQPRLPADLGFYDLRISEARIAQAELAKQYGIYGFCYWHYWFAGKQILERPFQEVVELGKPDFPFCLAWANQTWKGTWHGLSNDRVLVEQTYPGAHDHESHFYYLLDAFKDNRYIEVGGKKLFCIFQPLDIPDVRDFIQQWQTLAHNNGLNGFHFVALHMSDDWSPTELNYNASVQGISPWVDNLVPPKKYNIFQKFFRQFWVPKSDLKKMPRKVSYRDLVQKYPVNNLSSHQYPILFSDWDNTARSGDNGWLFTDFSIDLFRDYMLKACQETENKNIEEKFIFIKSWNEWAEGNYLEPDIKFGLKLLESFKDVLINYTK